MSVCREIEPSEADKITQDIRETLGFLHDVIDHPVLLRRIPTGSVLEFRTIQIGPHRFRLTAYRPSGSDGEWSCRVTKHARATNERAQERPRQSVRRRRESRLQRSALRAQRLSRPLGGDIIAKATTLDAAFNGLEQVLRERLGARSAANVYN